MFREGHGVCTPMQNVPGCQMSITQNNAMVLVQVCVALELDLQEEVNFGAQGPRGVRGVLKR